MSKIPVLVIFAPTATGKTELTGRLFSDNAPSFFAGKAEIISMDSQQVYRNFNIGTAKPEKSFIEHLPHHLIDCMEPTEQFGSGLFMSMADELCVKISERGKLPVLCGGTSFYARNFIFGQPVTPESNQTVRRKIQERLKTEGTGSLYDELCRVDKVSAGKIHPNDAYRICRALEVFHSSGKPLSGFEIPACPRPQYDFTVIYLKRDREELYRRIDRRVLKMFDDGLVEEMEGLLLGFNGIKSFNESVPAFSAIGYREFFTSGEDPHEMFRFARENPEFKSSSRYLVWLSEIKRQIQRDSRHYAKKQITFFEPIIKMENPGVHVVAANDVEGCLEILKNLKCKCPTID